MLTFVKEVVIVVAAALVLSLIIKTFFFQSFWIPSPSMEDTLERGDRIIVTKWRPGPLEVRRGDLVVFRDPGGWLGSDPDAEAPGALTSIGIFVGLLPDTSEEHLVKRVIGLPGDVVSCSSASAQVHVNGEPLDEPYLKPGSQPCGRTYEVTVPDGYLWLLGDNRNNSADSRAHMGRPGGGTVPVSAVVGTVMLTVWPFDNAGTHGNPYED